jgi:hypothetical protein
MKLKRNIGRYDLFNRDGKEIANTETDGSDGLLRLNIVQIINLLSSYSQYVGENEKIFTLAEAITLAQYGYEYHQKSQFTNTEFKDECINNTKQLIHSMLWNRTEWDVEIEEKPEEYQIQYTNGEYSRDIGIRQVPILKDGFIDIKKIKS